MRKYEQSTNDLYLQDISDDKYNIIPLEIEKELLKSAKDGSKKSEQQLINAHLRLVVNVAKHYGKRGEELQDLIQEGNLGLYDAIKRYDPSKNVRFCYYAKWWIRKYIVTFLQMQNKINDNELLYLDNDDEEEYKDTEIAQNAELDTDEEEMANKKYSITANQLLDTLDDRMKFIIESIYGLNGMRQSTLIQLSKILNISPERVRQLKLRAMMILRNNALANSFSDSQILK